MDVVIPSHSVRLFGAALHSLHKIGSNKDLYWEFDPISGLTIQTLNDAKSAYARMHFAPSFFERCTRPPRLSQRRRGSTRATEKDTEDEEENQLEHRFSCRVTGKALAPIIRSRGTSKMGVHSLRIVGLSAEEQNQATDHGIWSLEFEFTLMPTLDTDTSAPPPSKRSRAAIAADSGHHTSFLKAVHRVRIADAVGVSVVTNEDGASELVVAPTVLARLLEPLQRTVEAALIVRHNNNNNGEGSSVSATSFHPSETTTAATTAAAAAAAAGTNSTTTATNPNNAILQATSASLLKSETACGRDEFLEFDFVSDRELVVNRTDDDDNRRNRNGRDANDDNDDDDDMLLPEDVNREVILVFSIKEAKAMLQFCCTQSEDLVVHLLFHWGGKPVVLKASHENVYSFELVLATLDYKLLTSMRTMEASSK